METIICIIVSVIVSSLVTAAIIGITGAEKNDALYSQIESRDNTIEALKSQVSRYIESKGELLLEISEKEKRIKELSDRLAVVNLRNAILSEEIAESEPEQAKTRTKRNKPAGHSNWYPAEPHTGFGPSEQLKLQSECKTVEAFGGIRMWDGPEVSYFCAAIGNIGENEIGDTWEVELRNGRIFNIICSDFTSPAPDGAELKEERYPDDCYDGIIEFVADFDEIDGKVLYAGTFGVLPFFGGDTSAGDIIGMKYTGRKWKP